MHNPPSTRSRDHRLHPASESHGGRTAQANRRKAATSPRFVSSPRSKKRTWVRRSVPPAEGATPASDPAQQTAARNSLRRTVSPRGSSTRIHPGPNDTQTPTRAGRGEKAKPGPRARPGSDWRLPQMPTGTPQRQQSRRAPEAEKPLPPASRTCPAPNRGPTELAGKAPSHRGEEEPRSSKIPRPVKLPAQSIPWHEDGPDRQRRSLRRAD